MSIPYAILPARSILAGEEEVPDEPGLYMFLLHTSDSLNDAFRRHDLKADLLRLGRDRAIYFGSTANSLRVRLKQHLCNDSRVSTFRRSLGLLLQEDLALEPVRIERKRYFHFGEGEARLTAWIADNLTVALRPCADAHLAERALIEERSPPLNMEHRHRSQSARRLKLLRSRHNGLRRPPRRPGPEKRR